MRPKPFQFNKFVLILNSYGVKHKTCKDHFFIGTKVHDVCLIQQNINARSITGCLYQNIFTIVRQISCIILPEQLELTHQIKYTTNGTTVQKI